MGGMIQKAARFLRIGQLPDLLRTKIGAEGGFLWLEEGILVTAILRDFKAPGTFCGYRRISFLGFAAMTQRRMVVSARFFNQASMDVDYDGPRFKDITFSLDGKHLSLSFNAAGFLPNAAGEVTLRLGVSDLPKATQILRQKGARGFGEPCSAGNGSLPVVH
jgi:hypothetical protein